MRGDRTDSVTARNCEESEVQRKNCKEARVKHRSKSRKQTARKQKCKNTRGENRTKVEVTVYHGNLEQEEGLDLIWNWNALPRKIQENGLKREVKIKARNKKCKGS